MRSNMIRGSTVLLGLTVVLVLLLGASTLNTLVNSGQIPSVMSSPGGPGSITDASGAVPFAETFGAPNVTTLRSIDMSVFSSTLPSAESIDNLVITDFGAASRAMVLLDASTEFASSAPALIRSTNATVNGSNMATLDVNVSTLAVFGILALGLGFAAVKQRLRKSQNLILLAGLAGASVYLLTGYPVEYVPFLSAILLAVISAALYVALVNAPKRKGFLTAAMALILVLVFTNTTDTVWLLGLSAVGIAVLIGKDHWVVLKIVEYIRRSAGNLLPVANTNMMISPSQ